MLGTRKPVEDLYERPLNRVDDRRERRIFSVGRRPWRKDGSIRLNWDFLPICPWSVFLRNAHHLLCKWCRPIQLIMSNPILFLYKYAQCSSTCEGGFKVRKVTCQQVLALGQALTKTANQCNPTSRPAESTPYNFGKICSKDEQVPTTTPTTTTSSVATPDLLKIQWTHQNFVQQSQKKKMTLKVGGKATVFKGQPSQDPMPCPTLRQVRTVKRGNFEQKKAFFRCFFAITFFLFQMAKN